MITARAILGWGALLDVNEREKQLLRPVRFVWEDDAGLQSHDAEQGYQFDGASKWFAWRLLGYPWGASARASLIHDRAFTERFRLAGGERVTLEYAADLYLAFLKFTGVGRVQRYAEWAATRFSPQAKRLWASHDGEFPENESLPGSEAE